MILNDLRNVKVVLSVTSLIATAMMSNALFVSLFISSVNVILDFVSHVWITPLFSIFKINQKFDETVILSLDNKPPPDVSHTHLTQILSTTTTNMLPKRARAAPLSFASSKEALRDSIDHHDKDFDYFHKVLTPINNVKYDASRRIARLRVRQAKSDRIIKNAMM